ncbi:response regulator [Limnoglobus roseus]|uniref:PAS domain S-box protein n=1 Tax=Limnoglobus roseus TaxID=2598579 RepID=A0A5C1ASN4_9BACT|nr:response regulator [Limnoglobus roseus]QEL21103.1 PAS domain S-box protein [Limnoglobus roseus]
MIRIDAAALGAGKTALLVDDNAAVRGLTRLFLRRLGFAVLEATSGAEAEAVAGTQRGEIDLVVTDMVMPDGGGRFVADRMADLCPAAKVLFVSGYSDDLGVGAGEADDRNHFLAKPFTPDAFADKVRVVLNS